MPIDDDYSPPPDETLPFNGDDEDIRPGPSRRKGGRANGLPNGKSKEVSEESTRPGTRTDGGPRSRPINRHGRIHTCNHGMSSSRKGDCKALSSNYWRGDGGNGEPHCPQSKIRMLNGSLGRAMMSETPLRRSIIRHMFIIIDLSDSMRDKDFRPSR